MGGISLARGWGVFRSLAGNQALARVVGGYVLFTVAQYSVWVAMLVYAYRQGGAAVAGLVAVAQLVRRRSWRLWRRPSRTGAPRCFCWPAGIWCRRGGWRRRPWR